MVIHEMDKQIWGEPVIMFNFGFLFFFSGQYDNNPMQI